MRTFIAIDLPQNIKDEVLRIQNFLVENIDGFKWEKKEKFHITLKFLGEILDSQYQSVISVLEKISATNFSFDLFLDKLNVFPNFRNPRVIVMNLKNEDDSIFKIVNEIEKNVSQIGIVLDNKKFMPHITLGRSIRNHHHYDLQTILENLKFEKHKTYCSEIVFYKSILKPTGSQYIALKNFILQKK